MDYEIRDASRSQAKPLIGLYSESGGGKTYSALLLARGFVGPTGRICMIETESGRGEAYADPAEYPEIGGYSVLPLREDFSPKNYGAAIKKVEDQKFDALIIDSASHEWEGQGGVLDLASQNEAAGKKGMLVWQQPKIDHQKHFMLKFMQTPIPLVILNMRAKYPMTGSGANLKRSEILEPKQSEDILYEMTAQGWLEKETHKFHPSKRMPRSFYDIFPDGQPISLETGQKLAAWAKGNKTAAPTKDKPPHVLMAEAINRNIKDITDPVELQTYMAEDPHVTEDMAKIKEASQATWDFVNNQYQTRLKALQEG